MRESVRVASRDEMPEDRSPSQQPFPYLTREEVERFFRAIPTANVRDRALFDLIYRHGLRRREAAQLTLDDVQGGKIWIARVKRGVSGGYPLHPRSKQLLREYIAVRPNDECRYLFRTRRRSGTPISGSEINRLFHAVRSGSGPPGSALPRSRPSPLDRNASDERRMGSRRRKRLARPPRHFVHDDLRADHEQAARTALQADGALSRNRPDGRGGMIEHALSRIFVNSPL